MRPEPASKMMGSPVPGGLGRSPAPFTDMAVKAAFDAHPEPMRSALLSLRDLVIQAAARHPEIGELIETLKWGEPAYLPKAPRVGTTIRLSSVKNSSDTYAMYFHCRTTLIQTFRAIYADEFAFEGARAIVFCVGDEVSEAALEHCIVLALSYHLGRSR